MIWLILVISLLVFTFGFVIIFGPPYIPTLSKQIDIALDLLDLKPGETMLELGSGDGKVVIAAAERGWKVVGYELNPILVLISKLRTRRYKRQVSIVWGNIWTADWPEAEGIFTFLLGRQMEKLNSKIKQMPNRPIKLVSFAFIIPGKKATKQRGGIHLYRYSR